MGKGIVATAVGLLCVLAFAADTQPSIPKEGKIWGAMVLAGPLQVVPLGGERARIAFDLTGVQLAEPDGLLHHASVRCAGAITVASGSIEEESGVCVYTRLDGDQAFTATTKVTGRVGPGSESKGVWKFTGGTGKLAGIQGGGEFTRFVTRRAAEGTSQSVVRAAGTYKLPTTTAER